MMGPATNTRVEAGLNVKGFETNDRLLEQPSGRMCNYIVKLTDAGEVNAELISWIKMSFEAAA